jgi:hypothetical protein
MQTKSFLRLTLILGVLLLTSCLPSWGKPSSMMPTILTNSPTYTPFLPADYTPLPTVTLIGPTASSIPLPRSLWIDPSVPGQLASFVEASGFFTLSDRDSSDVQIINTATADVTGTATWTYALVAPFPTIEDSVSFSDVVSSWRGEAQGPFSGLPLLMEESTRAAFTTILGAPAPGAVVVAASDQLLEAWNLRSAWGIVPFEELEPGWKVISVDGQSPLHNDFDVESYPLKVFFRIHPDVYTLPASNRDPTRLTSLIMTGVTALVRSTAGRMEDKGITYPGEDNSDLLLSADLTHISNEVPFAENCPYPYPLQESLTFCSDIRYIALLEDIGTDLVELTGNHFQDYGSEATLLTLDMYDERGLVYFGGGRDKADAQKALLVEHNGNKLAFIGCNPVGPANSWASEDSPGSAECDYEFMYSEISRLRADGYLPIVTFQHYEIYSFYPSTAQIADFRSMAAAGAVIVSGSQSHFPQYMELYENSFIHYGLGNLFFDQMDYPAVGTRREFADRHVFYDGRYMGVELLTFMLEDYARPRPMTDTERNRFLGDIFEAAGW